MHMNSKKQQEKCEYHQIQNEKKHYVVVNHFREEISNLMGKQYLSFSVDKVFGQYVHTRMFLYYLIAQNGNKVTVCMQVYCFEPKEIHGFVDYAHDGYMKPATAQKKLIQMDNWPSCGAYWRSQQCDQEQVQRILDEKVSLVNQKLQYEEQGYTIVRCWSQCVQGTNYFMHVISNSGKKASVGMYVPFDYGGEDEVVQASPQNCIEEREVLEFQMDFCKKGHVSFE